MILLLTGSCALFSTGQQIIVSPYLQDVCTDSVTIMWESADAGEGQVLYGSSPFSLDHSVTSSTVNVEGVSQIHTAIVSGLVAKSKYYYKVEMQEGEQSKLRTFRTLAEQVDNEDIQLMAVSDMQRDGSHPNKFQEIIENGIAEMIFEKVGPYLEDLEGLLIPGDLVPTGGVYDQWQSTFFSPSDSISGYVPFYPVLGNHEYHSGGEVNFKHYFTLPANGPTALQDECWYKDISNVRVIGLNSNSGSIDQNVQLQWLSQVLDEACASEHIDFVFAQLHHPFKSELWTPGENDFTGKVIDSLEQFTDNCTKASIHFFGHTHGYSRGQSRDHKHLWVNVATAGGAIDNWGEFPNADYKEFVKSQDEYGFVYIDVTAGDDPQFVLQRYSIGDQDVVIDNELRDEITILNYDIAPVQPSNIFPILDTLSTTCVVLKGSEFYGLEDSLQGSQWQIATDSAMTNLVAQQWWQNENWYNEVDLQANDDLTDASFSDVLGGGQYYWNVRYRNQSLEWSPWSVPTKFYVESSDTLTANLLVNANAESGVTGWFGDIESLENGECNSVLPYEGDYNFAVGGVCANESSFGEAFQKVDLSNFASQIDGDTVALAFGAYLRSFGGSDIPGMYVEIYDGSTLIATSSTLTQPNGEWEYVSQSIKLPVSVDNCKVYLTGTRIGGTDNDSYFDLLDLYLVRSAKECKDCFGSSNIDLDADGFCSDVDCNDNDATVYPGALEICDGLDNNCDGRSETSDTVIWTGGGGSLFWGDNDNWDQNLIPLPCQHVIIDNNVAVEIIGNYQCKSIEVETGNVLTVTSGSTLLIDSYATNNYPSALIKGTMLVNGKCSVKSSDNSAFEVYGNLINNNKINTELIEGESVIIRTGGQFSSLGKSIFR